MLDHEWTPPAGVAGGCIVEGCTDPYDFRETHKRIELSAEDREWCRSLLERVLDVPTPN